MIITLKNFCVALFVAAIFSTSCEQPEEKKKLENVNGATENLTKVNQNFTPASLQSSGTSASLNLTDTTTTGLDFFSLQPTFLKTYLTMGQSMVSLTTLMVSNFALVLADKEVGKSGSEQVTDDEDGSSFTIDYTITSETAYKATIVTDKGRFLHLSVDKNAEGKDVYRTILDLENDPDREEDSTSFKRVVTDVVFTSETDFDVEVVLTGAECDSSNISSPSFINIIIDKEGDTWKGKSMFYFPRWLDRSATCDTEANADNQLYMYTDFVGNDTNTTASLHMANGTFDNVDNIGDFNIENFCTNFSDNCVEGKFGSGAVIEDTYINPFCATAAGAVTWNGACGDLPASDYGPAADWKTPEGVDDAIANPAAIPESL